MRIRLPGIVALTMAAALCVASAATSFAGASTAHAGSAPVDAKWTLAPPIPLPPGANSSALQDVTVVSPTDVWAVGSWWDAEEHAFAIHWTGTTWDSSATPKPDPRPSNDQYALNGVDAVSATDVWAVGRSWTPSDVSVTSAFVVHYNGSVWSEIATPPTTTGTEASLADVDMLGADDGWAVGQSTSSVLGQKSYILRWQGRQWIPVPAPKTKLASELTSVFARSATDVWAVGWQLRDNGRQASLVAHWDGVQWSDVTVPGNAGMSQTLSSVAATDATDVWVAGSSCLPTGPPRCSPLILRLTEVGWETMPAATGTGQLSEVVAFTPKDVWVMGQGQSLLGANVEHVEHWDGVQFTVDASAVVTPGGQLGTALALAAAAGDPVSGVLWAVGWVDRPFRQANVIYRQ
jgi:hypothetical protein